MSFAGSHAVLYVCALFATELGACNSTSSSRDATMDCSQAQAGMACAGDASCLSDPCGGGEGFVCVDGKWKLVSGGAVLPKCPDVPPLGGSTCPACWPGGLECKYADGKRASQIVESGVLWSVCATDGTIVVASCDTKTWTVASNMECRRSGDRGPTAGTAADARSD